MPQTVGQLAEAGHYNDVAEVVNKIFGDKYPSALVTDSNRKATHKFGWGAVNIDDALLQGTLITADRLQTLVDHTNLSIDHINVTDSILVFAVPVNRTTISSATLVRAEDLNLIESKFNNTILANDNHAYVDPTDASLLPATPLSGAVYKRVTPWINEISGEHKFIFDNYTHARHFFNGGGQLQLFLEMSGGCTAGYFNWADIVNEAGTLVFNWNTLYQSEGYTTAGISHQKGFYDLTNRYGDGSDADGIVDDEGLLFTSAGTTVQASSGYGYGYGYGYGGYTAGIFVSNPTAGYGYAWSGSCFGQPVYIVPISGYNTGYGYGYGYGYGSYGGYSNRYLKVYGKWANNGSEVHFKVVLDNTTFNQPVDGTIEATCNYLMPNVMTLNQSEFDVTPEPRFDIIDNFNTGDDS